MPVGAARGVWLSGARAPHGGRTWGERVTVDVLGHGSSLSPHHITPGADHWVHDRAPCPVAVEVESEDSEVGSTEPPAGAELKGTPYMPLG